MYTTTNLTIPLTATEESVIIGTILGDANIRCSRNNRPTGAIYCGHSAKQIEWCQKKAEYLKRLMQDDFEIAPKNRYNKSRKKYYNKVEFTTKYTTELFGFRQMFYPDGVKIIPKNITSYLTPLTLAVWYMDDGCIEVINNKRNGKVHYVSNAIKLHTNGFSKQDIEILREAILTGFNVKMRLKFADKKKHYVLYTKSRIEIEKFITIIKPFVIKEMEYKIITSYTKKMKEFLNQEKIISIAKKLNLREWKDFKKLKDGKKLYDATKWHFGTMDNFRLKLSN